MDREQFCLFVTALPFNVLFLSVQFKHFFSKFFSRQAFVTYQKLVDDINQIKPGCVANVLLLGPTGAGKSSTINSILSTAKGRRAYMAYTGLKVTSFTTKFGSYVDGRLLKNCCLWDTMGIDINIENGGILLDDLLYLLKGHVKKDYQFKPNETIYEEDPYFRKYPGIADQIHCVVFVFDAKSMDPRILRPYIEKIRKFKDEIQELDIPCVMLLTKIDELSTKIKEDITKTFYSIRVHDAVKTAKEIFGIPEGNIHPVKNYEADVNINKDANVLILLALRQAMYFAFDRIEKLEIDTKRRCVVS